MNIHEYQAKEILRGFGVPVPRGLPAFSADEAHAAAQKLGGSVWVVKAQIHAGGRGKAGGIKLARNFDEVKAEAVRMLGKTLVTHQTGPKGRIVRRLYIEEACEIAGELYLSELVDRTAGRVAFIASTEGGTNIEEVARRTPEKISMFHVDPAEGYSPFIGRDIAGVLKVSGEAAKQCGALTEKLYAAFIAKDMSLVEINPLVATKKGELICLDAKINFDDNALFRHPDVAALRDPDEEDPAEREAAKYELSYVKLDGSIGCMVNGAGLAMATMDIIKLYGKEPANFLDVGGGANREKVTAGLKIILSDKNVQGILVNIFGGIMRCDIVAEGIIAAAKEMALAVPLVVRLEGTNVERGREILARSNLPIIAADDLADAAQKIVKAVRGK
ncbi:MAG: ADP-forming succinate--CoA ligase subunit beta [Alphaproteobacteria bacterium]